MKNYANKYANKSIAASLSLASASFFLAASLASATPYDDFKKELLLVTDTSHADKCDVHVRIKEMIPYGIKEYYDEHSGKWYAHLQQVHKETKQNFAKNFGICLEFAVAEEWDHKEMERITLLFTDLKYTPPEPCNAVVGLTWTRIVDKYSGHTASLGHGNHSIIGLMDDVENDTTVYLHELGHHFAAEHSTDKKSVMYTRATKSTMWDKGNKAIITANKYRSWELLDELKELYAQCEVWKQDEEALSMLKMSSNLVDVGEIADKSVLRPAEYILRQLTVKHPESGLAYFQLGEVYAALGKGEDALAALEKAYALGLRQPALQNDIAFIMLTDGKDKQKALVYAQEAVRRAPWYEAYCETLGWAYYHNGRYKEAEQMLEPLHRLEKNGEYQYHLGMTYKKVGKHKEAQMALKLASVLESGHIKQLALDELKEYE